MSENFDTNGMSIAPGVVDTIIAIAVEEVDGVVSVGQRAGGGLRQLISGAQSHSGIETERAEDGKLSVTLHINAKYGFVLPELAEKIRQAVSDALLVQVGIEVSQIDVYIDGIQFDPQ